MNHEYKWLKWISFAGWLGSAVEIGWGAQAGATVEVGHAIMYRWYEAEIMLRFTTSLRQLCFTVVDMMFWACMNNPALCCMLTGEAISSRRVKQSETYAGIWSGCLLNVSLGRCFGHTHPGGQTKGQRKDTLERSHLWTGLGTSGCPPRGIGGSHQGEENLDLPTQTVAPMAQTKISSRKQNKPFDIKNKTVISDLFNIQKCLIYIVVSESGHAIF